MARARLKPCPPVSSFSSAQTAAALSVRKRAIAASSAHTAPYHARRVRMALSRIYRESPYNFTSRSLPLRTFGPPTAPPTLVVEEEDVRLGVLALIRRCDRQHQRVCGELLIPGKSVIRHTQVGLRRSFGRAQLALSNRSIRLRSSQCDGGVTHRAASVSAGSRRPLCNRCGIGFLIRSAPR